MKAKGNAHHWGGRLGVGGGGHDHVLFGRVDEGGAVAERHSEIVIHRVHARRGHARQAEGKAPRVLVRYIIDDLAGCQRHGRYKLRQLLFRQHLSGKDGADPFRKILRRADDAARRARPADGVRLHVAAHQRGQLADFAIRVIKCAFRIVEVTGRHARQHVLAIGKRLVERLGQACGLEQLLLERILVGHARCLFGDHASENVIGIRVEIAFRGRQVHGFARIGHGDQFGHREIPIGGVHEGFVQFRRLRIGRQAAGHVQQLLDRHVRPCLIFRQPVAYGVVDIDLALGFQRQDQRSGKALGVAADLVERVRADGLLAILAHRPGIGAIVRSVRTQADIGGYAGDAFGCAARRNEIVQPGLQVLLHARHRNRSPQGAGDRSHRRQTASRNEDLLHRVSPS